MKRFLAIYTGTAESMDRWKALSEEDVRERQAAGMEAWQQWAQRNQAAIVDPGAPLGRTRKASRAGIEDVRNGMAAYTIVQAATHEEAVELFRDHPHFSIFPGEAVEVMECLPIPG